jgi:hypothetical protein
MRAERILVATLNVASLVGTGERKGGDGYAPPRELRLEGARRPETVDEAVITGVSLLADWAGRQRVPDSFEWPEKLQGWLDDWEDDFRRSDGGDEAAGFRRLAELLDNMSRAIHASGTLQ